MGAKRQRPKVVDPTGHRGPGQRARLSGDMVLGTARRLVADEGLDALTLRRLAARLSVAPNAVYSYFPDKSALLDALMDWVLGEIDVDGLEQMKPRDALAELMRRSRRVVLDHAELLPRLLARPTRGPHAIRLGEHTLVLLERMGARGEAAVDALRILLIYTVGFVAQEAPRREDPEPEARRARSRGAFEADTDRPRVAALAEPLSRHPSEATFEAGLGWLLDGIARASVPRPS
jgi:TetR/AcrR family tetracycline transcriptional repressor